MKTKNRTQLIGYVGREPIIRACRNGNTLAVLRLATDERVKSNTPGRAFTFRPTWHDIAVWGEARVKGLSNITKGSHIQVEGKLEYQTYMDNKGIKRRVTEINATEITDLDR